jgi:hypothetical protein
LGESFGDFREHRSSIELKDIATLEPKKDMALGFRL